MILQATMVATLWATSISSSTADEPADASVLIVSQGEEGMALSEFLAFSEDVLGLSFVYEQSLLANPQFVLRLPDGLEVRKSEYLGFLENVLRTQGLLHLEQGSKGQEQHLIVNFMQSRIMPRSLARYHRPDQVKNLANRALLVTTLVNVNSLSPHQVVNSLQGYFGDGRVESIRAVDGTQSLILTGFSDNLASMMTLIEDLDGQGSTQPTSKNVPTKSVTVESQTKLASK